MTSLSVFSSSGQCHHFGIKTELTNLSWIADHLMTVHPRATFPHTAWSPELIFWIRDSYGVAPGSSTIYVDNWMQRVLGDDGPFALFKIVWGER